MPTAVDAKWVNEDLFDPQSYKEKPFGPASRSCCKVTNRNVCGSGSIVGKKDGQTFVLTNAHVAGSRVGHLVNCTFPFDENRSYSAKVVAAGYSDRTMMDWAVLVINNDVPLPAYPLSIELPDGKHYTGGYPKCQGPYFQDLSTHQFRNGGVVWLWRPDSIGGQSGSGVHDYDTDHQVGLLTWSYGGGYGAGQTARGIWFQYTTRTAIGIPRLEGLRELCGEMAEDLENGVHVEASITELPIWAHLLGDDDGEGEGDDDDGEGDSGKSPGYDPHLAEELLSVADRLRKEAVNLEQWAARLAKPPGGGDGGEGGEGDGDGCTNDPINGPTFGL